MWMLRLIDIPAPVHVAFVSHLEKAYITSANHPFG
jgi:hypothetical protein